MSQKAYIAIISTVVSKLSDFWRSLIVTYSVHVVVSEMVQDKDV